VVRLIRGIVPSVIDAREAFPKVREKPRGFGGDVDVSTRSPWFVSEEALRFPEYVIEDWIGRRDFSRKGAVVVLVVDSGLFVIDEIDEADEDEVSIGSVFSRNMSEGGEVVPLAVKAVKVGRHDSRFVCRFRDETRGEKKPSPSGILRGEDGAIEDE
jgi:hypothetical protein